MKILVTGSHGHIGSVFCPAAEAAGHIVTRYKRATPYPNWREFDALVHLAAAGVKPKDRQWASCLNGNFLGVMGLLNNILISGATPRVVLVTSCRENETRAHLAKWDDAYVVSKKMGTLFAHDWASHYAGPVVFCELTPCYATGEVEAVAQRLIDALTE